MKCNHKNKSKARQKLTQIILPTILLCTSSRIANKQYSLKGLKCPFANIICLWKQERHRLSVTHMINNQLAVKGGMYCIFVGSKAKMDFTLLSKRVSAHYSLGHRRHCIWDKIGKEHEGVTLIFFSLSLSFCTKLVVSLAYIYVTSRKVPPQLRDEAKNGWEGD